MQRWTPSLASYTHTEEMQDAFSVSFWPTAMLDDLYVRAVHSAHLFRRHP